MLDLSQPLSPVEGVTLFRDHEQPDLVYWLPDEIGLASQGDGAPDLSLQVFFPDAAVAGTEPLDRAVGSILSLGVHCTLSSAREALVRAGVVAQLQRDTVRLSAPPWEDGTVDLLLLDTLGHDDSAASITPADRLVKGIVGSRKPSLQDGRLSALFHARLDQRGTALVAAALEGAVGSVAGVLYDLKFAAMRPAIDLRMRAELNRVATFFRTSVGVQVYYVGADISAAFGEMRENGTIDVQVTSQMSDPESEKLVDQAVKDFYDLLMRELFKPTVSPAETIGAAASVAGAAGSGSIVKFSFAWIETEHERWIEVDYRKRSATRRTHNPQAHVRQLAAGAGGASRLVQRVPLSAAWRQFEVEIAAPDAFRPGAPLLQARAVLWRGRDGVLDAGAARDGGLRQPAAAAALADLALTSADQGPRRLAFVTMPDEPPNYWWQARFTYAQEDEVDSPSEVWSDPHLSSTSDLDLFPQVLAPERRVRLVFGAGPGPAPAQVDAEVVTRAADGSPLVSRTLRITSSKPEARWAVRRSEGRAVSMEARLVYHYPGGRLLRVPPREVVDRELVANSPFATEVSLTPLVARLPDDTLEVVFEVRYRDEPSGFAFESTTRLRPPGFVGDPVTVPVLRRGDLVAWKATVVRQDGSLRPLGDGESAGGVIGLTLGSTRRLTVEWIGAAPSARDIRVARLTVRTRLEDGSVGESRLVEFRGEEPPDPVTMVLPAGGTVEWSLDIRFEDGRRETTPFERHDDDLLTVGA